MPWKKQQLFVWNSPLPALQDTSLNLLFAGHDTSASAIMLAVRHLKLQPAVLEKLRREQQEVQ